MDRVVSCHSYSNSVVQTAFTIIISIILCGCAAKLAPDYDKAIFDGLTKANEEAMTMFAGQSSGSETSCSNRQKAYSSLLGKSDAVRIQINVRVSPPNGANLLSFVRLAEAQNKGKSSVASKPETPSSVAVQDLIDTIKKMQAIDRPASAERKDTCSFPPRVIKTFKSAFEISMSDALAYEKFLNR